MKYYEPNKTNMKTLSCLFSILTTAFCFSLMYIHRDCQLSKKKKILLSLQRFPKKIGKMIAGILNKLRILNLYFLQELQ